MGNDGGDIPGRKQLVRDKRKVEVATAESIAMGRSRFCNLTNQPLTQPLAICRLGNIYNYQHLLESLVKKELPAKYQYIRKLSDIKQVIIEKAPSYSDNYISCPISKLEYNGFNKFVAFWPCGHVVSRKALKEVKVEGKVCIICHEEYNDDELINLNLQSQRAEFLRRKLLQKRKKKEKKEEEEQQVTDVLKKKIKGEFHLNALDRLDGQFRDVIRNRGNFKQIFKKENENSDWQKNTYFVDSKKEEAN